MNEVLKVLKERRSIRAFRPEPLKKEDLDAIVEAGLYAPSAKNLQSTKLVVVRDAAVLARLERLNSRILGTPEGTPFYGAPEAIVVLSDSEYPNWLQDGSLVMGNLMNAAAALGIGSCWISAPCSHRYFRSSGRGMSLLLRKDSNSSIRCCCFVVVTFKLVTSFTKSEILDS